MRMVSENGQRYGQMVMDEIQMINEAGGINGNTIKATLLNDECKSDKGVANANKLIFQEKIHPSGSARPVRPSPCPSWM